MNCVGSELICGVRQVVMCKFTQYFNFLQHILRGFAKKLWGQLAPQLVHESATVVYDTSTNLIKTYQFQIDGLISFLGLSRGTRMSRLSKLFALKLLRHLANSV
jgi:hypothetical protein